MTSPTDGRAAAGGVDAWVRKWAGINGSGTAVTVDGESVSWAELDHRVDVLAHRLRSLGAVRGSRVGCLMHNSVEFIETLHATSRLGAIFVPLNVRYTATELGFALSHAGVSVLVTEAAFDTVVAAGTTASPPAILRRSDWPSNGPVLDEPSSTTWADDGFLLFTSGTTGTPRAVRHAHESFLWTSMDAVLIHRYSAADRMVTALPLCFTGGLNVATAMAHCGGELVLMSTFDVSEALDLIESRRATLFHGVPVMCERIVEHPRWPSADLSSLRLARTGAAPVSVALMQAWSDRKVALIQGYGLTESAGAGCTLPAHEAHRFGRCGRPSFYLDLRLVVPDTGAPARVGEPGEILLRGPQIMRGYWQEPEATAAAIRDGWLWTGDIGVVDEDGIYRIVGRSKELIITGGLNVYPAEVEHVLAGAPGVLEAAVVGVPSPRWGEQIVAVVVPSDAAVDVEAVLAHCRAVLADYKCPKSVVVSDEPLTRTASGKIVKADVRRLAEKVVASTV